MGYSVIGEMRMEFKMVYEEKVVEFELEMINDVMYAQGTTNEIDWEIESCINSNQWILKWYEGKYGWHTMPDWYPTLYHALVGVTENI